MENPILHVLEKLKDNEIDLSSRADREYLAEKIAEEMEEVMSGFFNITKEAITEIRDGKNQEGKI